MYNILFDFNVIYYVRKSIQKHTALIKIHDTNRYIQGITIPWYISVNKNGNNFTEQNFTMHTSLYTSDCKLCKDLKFYEILNFALCIDLLYRYFHLIFLNGFFILMQQKKNHIGIYVAYRQVSTQYNFAMNFKKVQVHEKNCCPKLKQAHLLKIHQ